MIPERNKSEAPPAVAVKRSVRLHRVKITETVELTSMERKRLLERAKTLGYDFDKAKPQVLLKRLLSGCIKDAVAASNETTY
jgi:hypothetical protein